MLAVVKTPHIDFKIQGNIPNNLLDFVKKEFGEHLIIEEDGEELVPIAESDWFKKELKNHTPGDTVRNYRENLRITQAELGNKIGNFSRQYISDIENNRRVMSKQTAKKLSLLFDISLDRLL